MSVDCSGLAGTLHVRGEGAPLSIARLSIPVLRRGNLVYSLGICDMDRGQNRIELTIHYDTKQLCGAEPPAEAMSKKTVVLTHLLTYSQV